MVNRNLDSAELVLANEFLTSIRARIDALAGGDPGLRFALNRKIFKELSYDERGKPAHRVALKRRKRHSQNGLCAICGQVLPEIDVHLDRTEAILGYTDDNTRLICRPCDLKAQQKGGFK
jgi:hypothetical protein